MVGRNDGQEASISLGRAAVDRLSRWLVLVAVGIAGLNLLIGFVKFLAGRDSVPAWLDFFESSDELTFPTWFSVLIIGAAAVSGALALTNAKPSLRLGFRTLTILLFYFSLDESAFVHERVNDYLQDHGVLAGPFGRPWITAALLLALVLGVVFVPFLLRLPRPVAGSYIMGGFIFVGGALGLEVVAISALESDGPGVVSDVASIFEELAEMLGMIIVGRVNLLVALHGVHRVSTDMIYKQLWRRSTAEFKVS